MKQTQGFLVLDHRRRQIRAVGDGISAIKDNHKRKLLGGVSAEIHSVSGVAEDKSVRPDSRGIRGVERHLKQRAARAESDIRIEGHFLEECGGCSHSAVGRRADDDGIRGAKPADDAGRRDGVLCLSGASRSQKGESGGNRQTDGSEQGVFHMIGFKRTFFFFATFTTTPCRVKTFAKFVRRLPGISLVVDCQLQNASGET